MTVGVGVGFDEVAEVLGDVDRILATVDVGAMVGAEPAEALKVLARHERAVAGLRSLLTAQAETQHQWRRQGYDSFEDWYAATQGTSKGKARQKTSTARKLKGCAKTRDALGKGDISEDQAETIADAADNNPDAEEDLLDTAQHKGRSHKDLQDQAARAKAAVEDDKTRARRLRADRTARWGQDRDGHWTLHARLEPQVGAEAQKQLETRANRYFHDNRKAGNREERDRYAADALAEMLTGTTQPVGDPDQVLARRADRTGSDATQPPPAPPPTTAAPAEGTARPADPAAGGETAPTPAPTPKAALFRIDLAAARRGCAHPDETVEIKNVGPVPVEVAMAWAADAFIKAVIVDGTDIRTVCHFGTRNIPELLRTALEERDLKCIVPTCDNEFQEWDHRIRHEHQGPISLANIRGPCPGHHHQITHDGYRIEGGPGHWRWIAPDGTVLLADDPDDLDHSDDSGDGNQGPREC